MILKGKAHKFADDVNTDDIIAAKYLVTTDPVELGKKCMETIAPDFAKQVTKGDIIAAGKNFGCGSSREHAPLAIKGAGISCVIASSFARIFYRNAINTGLPILEVPRADEIKGGDELEIDLTGGVIKNITQGKIYKSEGFPEFMQKIVASGGLMQWIRSRTNV
ncbi:MAG: 3-isopropylmalate dehydratase small subunit [Omnitrophica WOR_2 bacterium RIFCSPLOWO2_12_FULL_46_30]|nr:MAG: 3-isopropylmalate dehydratase small subunit [Omnitrophica WOR_2 bacterium RIFCSPHIGHO2_02_FULL_46_37]OGX42497.1 MAG: 3-isopropylmalate dehydratase small subunit [Omnitrophica WOR_2 bacterium RIFCSPLOWO2_02_FULL_45_28]OGX52332.1 MAG: 3-isopropylmalate dehydratase small subunit [Omnitrophica WOR_2 bacterium RIFCSPLOWO2_12_FULL_46_30]